MKINLLSGMAVMLLLTSSVAVAEEPKTAVAEMTPLGGSTVKGKVSFRPVAGSVEVEVDLSGITSGPRGFHIHEKGDCSAPDGSSAGGHFNPGGKAHGSPRDTERHAGDLGNLQVDKDGNAKFRFIDPQLKLSGADSIVGRSVIVHEKADDLKTKPTGDAGGRVACGEIK